MYAEVTMDISGSTLRRSFTYRIPEALSVDAKPGVRCRVPFGAGGRMADGYITAVTGHTDIAEERIKDIESIATKAESTEERLVALAARMAEYYSCSFIKALRVVLPARKQVRGRVSSQFVPESTDTEPPAVLTHEQQRAAREIRAAFDEGKTVLLEGKTGSGKTLIYMDLISGVLQRGGQAILLIPEIALTYQTVRRFAARFGSKVAFLHSRLSEGERCALRDKAREGGISVMIGPRSALFTPFPDLELIIIDEEHEETYRSESMPRYDARVAALWRAEAENARLLLGSATPSLLSQHRAATGEYEKVLLSSRYGKAERTVTLVDMRKEVRRGNTGLISGPLENALARTLADGHQAMLFLNRRGYAGFINCKSCGHVIRCPHCDVALTLHKDGRLHCHYCGFSKESVRTCPSCGSASIGAARAGTQQVVSALTARFPDAKILRMDADTTGGKAGHEKILARFASQEAQILVGTQMIVKGHDYPNVALTGILLADLSLFESDYRSAERTFALLTQAIGRAGRADVPGQAIVQTYQPEHYAVTAALAEDNETFRKEEMHYREMMGYPPFTQMLVILGSGKEPGKLHKGMEHLAGLVRRMDREDTLRTLGPAPLPVYKVRDRYREGIYLRCGSHEVLRVVAARLTEYIALNHGFDELVIQFDYNG